MQSWQRPCFNSPWGKDTEKDNVTVFVIDSWSASDCIVILSTYGEKKKKKKAKKTAWLTWTPSMSEVITPTEAK